MISSQLLSLPLDENIETEQITYVCEVLNEQIKNNA
jgi:dTDP-4-amino-4,6-dideoxygalactose transaminase